MVWGSQMDRKERRLIRLTTAANACHQGEHRSSGLMHVPVSEGQQLGAKGDSAQPSRSRKGRRPGIMVNFRISASVWFGLGFANQPVAELGAGMPTSLLPTHHEATRAPLI